jgi:N-acetylglucosaminyldiphosphoundecaprenol N-acetyl-beta-D-mannosaminyltransferase
MRQIFLGCPIDILTMTETVNLARVAMRNRRRLQHVALNVAKLVNMRRDPVLAADVIGSDLVTVDGMGVVWGARLFGLPVKERVTGVDLLQQLLAVCAEEGLRPYFLGATRATLQQAAAQTLKMHPLIGFAGTRDGYFTKEQEQDVIDDIRRSGADCLFIGMPTPRKERFLAAYRDSLNVPFIMGVGGSFDILAGQVRRAPTLMQSLGLEWLYRIYQEPGRMWWRYAKTNTLFAGILVHAVVQQSLHATPRMGGVVPPSSTRGGG